jgi:hypothetical protein
MRYFSIKALKFVLFFILFGIYSSACSFEENFESNSSLTKTTNEQKMYAESTDTKQNRLYNPLISGSLSGIIPGCGQFYTKNYFPAISFLGAEIIMGFTAYSNSIKFDTKRSQTLILADSLRHRVSSIEQYTELNMKLDYSNFETESKRVDILHTLTWATGCYYFNVLSALDHSGAFYSETPRKPSTAGWLAAIPFLGLGQLYNGSLKKAGMVSMVQVSLAVLSYNNQVLMHTCEQRLATMADTTTPEHAYSTQFYSQWNGERRNTFQKRNTYLWYSVLFYFYGIFDAIVDANLHDIGRKITLEPDLSFTNERAGLNISFEY